MASKKLSFFTAAAAGRVRTPTVSAYPPTAAVPAPYVAPVPAPYVAPVPTPYVAPTPTCPIPNCALNLCPRGIPFAKTANGCQRGCDCGELT